MALVDPAFLKSFFSEKRTARNAKVKWGDSGHAILHALAWLVVDDVHILFFDVNVIALSVEIL